MNTRPPGERLSFWLAAACRAAREEAGQSQSHVATLAGMNRSAIHGFEEIAAWPRKPELLVRAYAESAGLEDSRLIWTTALEMWQEFGEDAALPPTARQAANVSAKALAKAAREIAEQLRSSAAEPETEKREPEERAAS